MTELEFRQRWIDEEPMYEALGRFVVSTVCEALNKCHDLSMFLKIPAIPRTKNMASLVEKAFYRNKNYPNPYEDITDKVGVRFVVLIQEEIKEIERIIEDCPLWAASKDKDYLEEQRKHPKIFDYESVHYVVRLNSAQIFQEVHIPEGIACEIQIRSLLQHACSELTHDAIYKAKTQACAGAERACSRAIALSEATDECFMKTFEELEKAAVPSRKALQRLRALYLDKTGRDSESSRVSDLIVNSLLPHVDDDDWKKIAEIVDAQPHWISRVNERFLYSQLHQEPTIFLIYYFLHRKKHTLVENWPLTRRELEPLAADIGEVLPG